MCLHMCMHVINKQNGDLAQWLLSWKGEHNLETDDSEDNSSTDLPKKKRYKRSYCIILLWQEKSKWLKYYDEVKNCMYCKVLWENGEEQLLHIRLSKFQNKWFNEAHYK